MITNFSIKVNINNNNAYNLADNNKYYVSLYYNVLKNGDLSFYIPAAKLNLGKVINLSSIKKKSIKFIKTIFTRRNLFSNFSLFKSLNIRQQNCCMRL